MLRVFVITSDYYRWALAPFAHLFNTYWSALQPVVIAGFAKPPVALPKNFNFHQIAPQNYPANKWSNGLIEFLLSVDDEHFVLMLEDYWLTRTVDTRGVSLCHDLMKDRPNILRFDLTDDRQYSGKKIERGGYGSYDIIETPHGTPYQMSTQAGIWNRKLMLELLEPDKTAWEVEIYTQPPDRMRVMGTRQCPVRYANVILKGRIDHSQLGHIPEEHYHYVTKMIPPDFGKEVG